MHVSADEDFQSSSGTLTFDPGDMSEPIPVTVKGDLLDEDDETLTVTLSAPVRATLCDDHGTGTISDDDEMPQLTINDVTVNEGNTGTTNATFIVTRFGGKTRRLTAGSYRWYVWPGLAKRSAKKYGPMVGESIFTVKARKATKRR